MPIKKWWMDEESMAGIHDGISFGCNENQHNLQEKKRMDLESILSEVTKNEKDKNHTLSHVGPSL